MNNYRILLYCLYIPIFSYLMLTGCEYDVASPQWDQDFESVPIPEITQVSPSAGAAPGVNTITITGTNFLDVPDTNGVYFDNIPVEIISNSNTSIRVRRPDLVADGATIKVVPNQTLLVAKHSPYRIDPVVETYGSFLDDNTLYASAVDADENLYVIESGSPRSIYRVSAAGDKEVVGATTYSPTDAMIGPDGKLYMTRNNREILVFDPTAGGEAERWTQLPRGMVVSYGVFNIDGYFYCGGRRSDLVILPPNPPVDDPPAIAAGYYEADEITSMTIYQNYIYLAVRMASPDEQHPESAIWRHTLGYSGTVGNMELFLDLTTNEEFASREVKSISFDANGNLFIGTDAQDPLLINIVGSGEVDYFYKNILQSNCKHFTWGTGNYLYMISGDDVLDVTWAVYRVDMGAPQGQ